MNISEDLKVKYFDIIYEFGLMTNTGLSPCESPGQPFRIHCVAKDKDGIRCQTTCYGKDIEQVCAMALEWLEAHNWKG